MLDFGEAEERRPLLCAVFGAMRISQTACAHWSLPLACNLRGCPTSLIGQVRTNVALHADVKGASIADASIKAPRQRAGRASADGRGPDRPELNTLRLEFFLRQVLYKPITDFDSNSCRRDVLGQAPAACLSNTSAL